MYNRNHSNALSEKELKELLGSLPTVQAPVNLESQILNRIGAEHLQVAHLLTNLSPVQARPDFDERLFRAIREHKRRGAVVPTPFAGGTTFATMLKGLGWFRTGIAAGAAIAIAVGGSIVHNSLPSTSTSQPKVQQPHNSTLPSSPITPVEPHAAPAPVESSALLPESTPASDSPATETPARVMRKEHTSRKATRPTQATTSSDTEAQHGEQLRKPSSVTTAPVEVQDTLSASTPTQDVPPTSIPTGDSVNTGGDDMIEEPDETAPVDSTQVKY